MDWGKNSSSKEGALLAKGKENSAKTYKVFSATGSGGHATGKIELTDIDGKKLGSMDYNFAKHGWGDCYATPEDATIVGQAVNLKTSVANQHGDEPKMNVDIVSK